jgi:hypothetical protein
MQKENEIKNSPRCDNVSLSLVNDILSLVNDILTLVNDILSLVNDAPLKARNTSFSLAHRPTVPVKSLDKPTHLSVFLYFCYFLHYTVE